MQIDAIPTQFVTATEGHLRGQDHVILFMRPAGQLEAQGYALNLSNARRALAALTRLVSEAEPMTLRVVREAREEAS